MIIIWDSPIFGCITWHVETNLVREKYLMDYKISIWKQRRKAKKDISLKVNYPSQPLIDLFIPIAPAGEYPFKKGGII